jgi:hypothetical protein
VAVGDTQFTYKYYYSLDAREDGVSYGTGENIHTQAKFPIDSQGTQTLGLLNVDPPRTDDPWSTWQYEANTADTPFWENQALPDWVGCVGLYLAAGAGPTAFCTIAQLVRKDRWLAGERFTLAFDIATDSDDPIESGVIKIQAVRYDRTVRTGYTRGIERDISEASFSATTILPMTGGAPGWERASMQMTGTLPIGEYVTSTAGGATNASRAITCAATADNWIGCTAKITNGTVDAVARIKTVVAGVGFAMADPTVMTDGAGSDLLWAGITGPVTITVEVAWTDIEVKIGLEGPATHGGVAKTVYIRRIMMNGGRLGAPWTPVLLPDASPGGPRQGLGNRFDWDRAPATCVPAGTPVDMADGEFKPVELVREGDMVLGYNRTKQLVPCRVEQRQEHRCGVFVTFATDHGQTLVCTDTHRLAVWRKTRYVWKEAKDLKIGDIVYVNVTGTVCREKIVSLSSYKSDLLPVYTLTVDRTHNYFAGGILCHNKPKENLG